ncbi:hypothetical protein [Sinomonas humi]|uniref:Uncharacterized protein n=1 Tax=Sinomonas humi TaxID=1338436 RepID=A0A0B2AJ92_9MICC|nr:hypothetical protein [Sinomonas humi]KHL01896.1 hypothetical protein LK10_14090 [Sinomonas humi]
MSNRVLGQQPGYPQGPSTATIVWGAILVIASVLLAAARLGWLALDPRSAVVSLIVLAGLGLLIGGALAAVRGGRRSGRP